MEDADLLTVDTIIIGAGAAGLMAAASLFPSVLVLEKKKRPGLKLLISGSGQCNLTHSGNIEEFLFHYGSRGRFLKPALYSFSNTDTVDFFESRNTALKEREDGKVFPESLRSSDILNCLLSEIRKKGNRIEYNSAVTKVEKRENSFVVRSDTEKYRCRNLIIASGGKSYPETGSTGDGYLFAESLGHPVIKPLPGLTPVRIKNHKLSDLSGISFKNLKVFHWRYGKKIAEYEGDLLITHNGLSGPVILDNSRNILTGDILKACFSEIPDGFSRFRDMVKKSGRLTVKKYLHEYELPSRLSLYLINASGIGEDIRCADIRIEELKKLYENISSFPFSVSNTGGFNEAMVTAGGVDISFIDPRSMESRIHKNLYFAGEVIDIDGDSGGYNIQAAFSTGRKAADSINKRNN